MKDCFIAITVFLIIFVPLAQAKADDFQSVTSHYDQYSTDNISSSLNQYEVQYSPKNLDNPYTQAEVQYSPNSVVNPFAQQEHDYRAHLVSPDGAGKAAKRSKQSPEAAQIAKFFDDKGPKNIPVFLYLLIISSLALGATIFIFIGVFKK